MKPDTALFLSGGGAKAAYQAGVIKGIASFYKNKKSPFSIICGNSAGAVNSAVLSCYNSDLKESANEIVKLWQSIQTDKIYHCSYSKIIPHTMKMLARCIKSEESIYEGASLLNNSPLHKTVEDSIDFKLIDEQIYSGNLKAISIACSCYSDHKLRIFYQSKNQDDWDNERHKGEHANINTNHLMASAAIPLIFPSVRINREYFGDGIVNQHAPLSAPIKLGAEKIFIIHLDSKKNKESYSMQKHPTSSDIVSQVLRRIFSDPLHTDHERLAKTNDILTGFNKKELGQARHIETMMLNPSIDIDHIAKECYRDMPKAIRNLYQFVGINQENSINLIAYLLFEKSFCNRLIELGIQDSISKQKEIINFID